MNLVSSMNSSTASSALFYGWAPLSGRVVVNYKGQVAVLEQHPAAVIGRVVLRPLIDGVCCVARNVFSLMKSVADALVPMPRMAYAAPISKLERAREAIGGLGSLSLSEEMIMRIIEDKTGGDLRPEFVAMVKSVIDYLGSVANPSDAYQNLVSGKLEGIARKNLERLAQVKGRYDRDMRKKLSQGEIGRLRREVKELKARIELLQKESQGQKSGEIGRIQSEYQSLGTQHDELVDKIAGEAARLKVVQNRYNELGGASDAEFINQIVARINGMNADCDRIIARREVLEGQYSRRLDAIKVEAESVAASYTSKTKHLAQLERGDEL